MEKVRKPVFDIIISQKEEDLIELQKAVVDITYSEAEEDRSDEVRISLQDRQDFLKNENYPVKADVLTLKIGYEGEYIHDCGRFEVDEVEYSSPPDVLTIKALSTNISKSLRQKNTERYESKTLKEIAEIIAKKHGLDAVTGIAEDIKMKRLTQCYKEDLAFLKEISKQYNYIFKIEDNKLVFYAMDKLLAEPPINKYDKMDIINISIRDKTQEIYKGCQVSYHCPKSGNLIQSAVEETDIPVGSMLKLNQRVESVEQARLLASANLKRHNSLTVEGSITVPGDISLVSGINIELTGLYKYDGIYHVKRSQHRFTRSEGYTTTIDIAKIRTPQINTTQPIKPPPHEPPPNPLPNEPTNELEIMQVHEAVLPAHERQQGKLSVAVKNMSPYTLKDLTWDVYFARTKEDMITCIKSDELNIPDSGGVMPQMIGQGAIGYILPNNTVDVLFEFVNPGRAPHARYCYIFRILSKGKLILYHTRTVYQAR